MCRARAQIHKWLTKPGVLRVPQITVYFWVIKALSTAMGEATSDYSVHRLDPKLAVCLGFAGFLVALVLQYSAPPLYRLDVLAGRRHGGRVGTMAADVLQCRLRRPVLRHRAPFYAVVLLAVFVRLAEDREDPLDSQRPHAAAGSFLLGLSGGNFASAPPSRPDRCHLPPSG